MNPAHPRSSAPTPGSMMSPWGNSASEWNTPRVGASNRRLRSFSGTGPTAVVYPQTNNVMGWQPWGENIAIATTPQYPLAPVTTLPVCLQFDNLEYIYC